MTRDNGHAADAERRIQDLKKYFDEVAWVQQESGKWTDTELEVSSTRLNDTYTLAEHRRNRATMRKRGEYLLDAGCGSRPYLVYGAGFRRHVCLDFSFSGLKGAREHLGECGLYVLGDMRNLPFKSDLFDGICSPYAIHHIPGSDNQRRAFRELYRALKPGASGIVIYDNPNHLGAWLLRHLRHFSRIRSGGGARAPEGADSWNHVSEALEKRRALLHYEPLPSATIIGFFPEENAVRIVTHSLVTEQFKKDRFRDTLPWRLAATVLLLAELIGRSLLSPLAAVWCVMLRKKI